MAVALQTGSVQLEATLSWQQKKTITGFPAAKQNGPCRVSASPAIGASDANQIYQVQATLAAGAAVTINLSSLTMPAFGDIINLARAYQLIFQGDGATWRYEPDAVAGFAGFLGGTNPTISGGDGEGFAWIGSLAMTIDGSHKNITITNTSGSGTLTYTLAVILGE